MTGRRIRQDQSIGALLAAAVLVLITGAAGLRAQNSPAQGQEKQASPPAQSEQQQSQEKQQQGEEKQPQGQEKEQPAKEAPAKPEQPQLSTPQLTTPQLTTPQLTTPTPTAPEAPAAKGQPQPVRPKQVLVEAVEFRGNRRIPSSRLQSQIFSRAGDVYNESSLERDFMALWNTGYFDDIRLEVQDGKTGKIVVFYLREKKLVRAITYKGLHSVEQSDVLEAFQKQKVGLTMDSQYDPVVIKRAEVVLQQMLGAHGRQFATVRHRTRNIPPNSVALTFIVNEGPKVKIGSIHFTGNTVFPNRELVSQMKLSRPGGLPPFFYWFHKTYDHDKVLYDLEKVRELYQNHGYFYALPGEPVAKMRDTAHHWPFFFWSWGHGKAVDVTIPVEEGQQYKLGKFNIRGNKLFKTPQLMPILGMKSGDVFDVSKMRKAIDNLTKLYGEFGYINFVATPDPEPIRSRREVNLTFDFDEGKQFHVHRIEFSGNTKTRDKVIRRELLVNEGEMFNTRFWDLSILKVNQLGFFQEIKKEDYTVNQNAKDNTVDIDLKVHEKGRNSIGFSGGVSGFAGNFFGFNYATNNFMGLGETLSVGVQTGQYEKLYTFGFTEPYVMDRPITTGFTVFKSDINFNQLQQTSIFSGVSQTALASAFGATSFQNFAQNSTGFTAFLSYPMRRHFARLGLTYSFSTSSLETFSLASQQYFKALNFRNITQGPNSLSGIRTSSIMPTYTYNTVGPNYLEPHYGKSIYAALQFAGSVLGGNVNTITPTIDFKYYHPINHGRNTVAFHVTATSISGYGGKVPPPFARFYMGGENDIRGFDIYSVSPVAFFPTVASVCNRDINGNIIQALRPDGTPTGTCGSFTRFPVNTVIFPGGDTEWYSNLEYRIPIIGPVAVAPFFDAGMDFIWHKSELNLRPGSLTSLTQAFPFFDPPTQLQLAKGTNFQPRSSAGIELQVIVPHFNIPFRLYYGYNWLRLNDVITPPQASSDIQALFPNYPTYLGALPYFQSFRYEERKTRLGFTVARTF
ncbi:MAG TPA: outer membrane protein assembly factor BamA [Terriglobia bacterium]|nr:outer membrane protein assembly factor BamA [Terriglobia bacterium]